MAAKTNSTAKPSSYYRGANIPMRLVRKFAREVAERFHPEKIILFGSYASGTPHEDSDVDILVVMPARNTTDMAIKIHLATMPPFPIDIIVRTPAEMRWRLAERESFLVEVVERGKVLYEKRWRPSAGPGASARNAAPFSASNRHARSHVDPSSRFFASSAGILRLTKLTARAPSK